jgi:hypothetical protein
MRGFIFFCAVMAVFIAIVGGLAWLIWRLTRKIRITWIRLLLRASVIAVVFTPTIVPDSSLHGAVPMPAAWALVVAVTKAGTREGALCLRYGSIPIFVSAGAIWLVSIAWTSFRASRRANAVGPKAF